METLARFRRGSTQLTVLIVMALMLAAGLVATSARPAAASSTWLTSDTYPAVPAPEAVACATPSICFAVGTAGKAGAVIASTDGGQTWSTQVIPSAITSLTSITCPSALECLALGKMSGSQSAVIGTTNGGLTWLSQTLPDAADLTSQVSCSTTVNCYIVGQGNFGGGFWSTSNFGTTWTAQALPAGTTGLTGAACTGPTACIVVGQTQANAPLILATANVGAAWTTQTPPTNTGSTASIACPTALVCFITGGTTITTANGGTTWAAVAFGGTGPIACASATQCFTTSVTELTGQSSGQIKATNNGGTSWSDDTLPTDGSDFYGMTCPSATQCLATGQDGAGPVILRTNDDGQSWTEGSLPFGVSALNGITCPSASMCLAVGQSTTGGFVTVTTDTGSSWQTQPIPAGVETLHAVTCTSTADCYAVGDSESNFIILDTTNGGATWSLQYESTVSPLGEPGPLLGTSGGVYSIACTSTQVCLAGAEDNESNPFSFTTANAGTTWTEHFDVVESHGAIGGLACPTSTNCYGTINEFGAIVGSANQGTNWTLQNNSTFAAVNGVACNAAAICMAGTSVAFNGQGSGSILATSNSGATWTSSSTVFAQPVLGMACAVTNYCVGVGGGGEYAGGEILATGDAQDGGSATWGSVPTPALTGPLDTVACLTDNECFAAGQNSQGGGLIIGDAGNQSSTTTTPSVSPTSVAYGSPVTYSVTVTSEAGTPDSSVTFLVGGTPLCAVNLVNGTASCVAANAPIGIDTVTAEYTGDESKGFAVSSGTTTVTVTSPSVTPTPPAPPAPGPVLHGYWLVGSDGGIFTFGQANFFGSTGSLALQRPVVGITTTSDRGGYWLVASDGGLFSFGDAAYRGSIPGLGLAPAGSANPKRLNAPIVGMVPSTDGGGYFMVGADGGVFAFGDAKYEGSCPAIGGCAGTAVAVMPDASGNGYWLVTATGHVYAFGDAAYYGAPGPQLVPVTSAARTPDGKGYWILFANGVVSTFGDANYYGSPSGLGGLNPASALISTAGGTGYWVASATGSVAPYGDAPFDGSMAGTKLNGSIIAAAGF